MTQNAPGLYEEYVGHLHWIRVVWPSVFSLFGWVLWHWTACPLEITGLLMGTGVFWMSLNAVSHLVTRVFVNRHSVVIQTGVFIQKTTEITLSKVESIDVQQNVLGSLLDYGHLIVVGTGGTAHRVNDLAHPMTCRRWIETYMGSR